MSGRPLDRVRLTAGLVAAVVGAGCAGLALTDEQSLPAGLVFLVLVVVAGLSGLYRYADAVAVLIGVVSYGYLEYGRASGLTSWGIATGALLFTAVMTRVLAADLDQEEERDRQVSRVVEDLTIHDAASGLLKSYYGEQAIEEEVRRARRTNGRVSLVLLGPDPTPEGMLASPSSLDGEAGLVGGVFREVLRATDRSARLGPALFAAILPDTGQQGAGVVATKLRLAAEERGSRPLRAGVATFPDNAVASSELREEAETALQLARTANLPVVSPDMLEMG